LTGAKNRRDVGIERPAKALQNRKRVRMIFFGGFKLAKLGQDHAEIVESKAKLLRFLGFSLAEPHGGFEVGFRKLEVAQSPMHLSKIVVQARDETQIVSVFGPQQSPLIGFQC
jgi:hypothetical protein